MEFKVIFYFIILLLLKDCCSHAHRILSLTTLIKWEGLRDGNRHIATQVQKTTHI